MLGKKVWQIFCNLTLAKLWVLGDFEKWSCLWLIGRSHCVLNILLIEISVICIELLILWTIVLVHLQCRNIQAWMNSIKRWLVIASWKANIWVAFSLIISRINSLKLSCSLARCTIVLYTKIFIWAELEEAKTRHKIPFLAGMIRRKVDFF